MEPKHTRYRLNVVGPFYVADGCCTACEVPKSLAPELFGEGEGAYCFVKRQPETPQEIDAMVRVMVTQEFGCIRYAGTDESLLRRLAENGEADLCDVRPPPGAASQRRDHVIFTAKLDSTPWTPGRILGRLVASASTWRTTAIFDRGTTATVSVSSFQNNFHRIEVLASQRTGEWLVRHHGPPRLGDRIHDWLTQDALFADVRWQTKAEWQANGPSKATPW